MRMDSLETILRSRSGARLQVYEQEVYEQDMMRV